MREEFHSHKTHMAWLPRPCSARKPKSFQNSLSHRILRHMHEALNIDENKN